MINVNKNGFSTSNTPEENSRIMQEAVLQKGDIYISEPGIYEMSEPVLIDDDTNIYFAGGVYIKRMKCQGETGYVFANRGAFTNTCNKNIKICGLKLICNNVLSDTAQAESTKVVPGLRGHISFYHVKNLTVSDCEMLDLPSKDFGIHVCDFNNIVIENVRIEGLKDAVHLGCGKRFVIRHGIFKTFDDPIALNAHDYASSNPMLGWIEDGIIEDCYDLDDESTTGFFCRILAGSWCDWKEGMPIQNSDSVVSDGTVYRALMQPDGKIYTSEHRPTHKSGMCVLDGINWVAVQNTPVYSCGCKNIHFRDIHIEKKRPVAFSLHFDKDNFSRSYYPNSQAPVQENITFENIYIKNDVPIFLHSVTPTKNVRIINSELSDSKIDLKHIKTEGIVYPETNFYFSGTNADFNNDFIQCDDSIKSSIEIK